MQTNDEIKARVKAGARWLEGQFGPEWIDLAHYKDITEYTITREELIKWVNRAD